jgi:hypothetical protein
MIQPPRSSVSPVRDARRRERRGRERIERAEEDKGATTRVRLFLPSSPSVARHHPV